MQVIRIEIGDDYHLGPVSLRDQEACVQHLRDKEIHDNTLRIPFPYTERQAEDWLIATIKERLDTGRETVFAIRRPDGMMIGAIGLDPSPSPHEHRAELGYWLAKPYWGQGIAGRAVGELTGYAFRDLKVIRLYATVFESNTASMRVLEKNGFAREGCLRRHFCKDGVLRDAIVFGLLAGDIPPKS